jgi:hypothetical protein
MQTTISSARPLLYGLLLWMIGMIIGTVVFSIPALKTVPPIDHVSANPAITVPVLLLWALVAWAIARRHLRRAADPIGDGLKLGVTLLLVNMVADAIVVVGAMKAGLRFYSFAGIWLAYAILLTVPVLVARSSTFRDVASRQQPSR